MAGIQRKQRVQESLKEAIIEVMPFIKDPRLGFVTLTGVDISSDLSYARVFFSVYGSDEERENSLQAMKSATGFIRREVARKIHLRVVPELDFRLDPTPERAEHIMKLLESIQQQDAQRGASNPGQLPEDGTNADAGESSPQSAKVEAGLAGRATTTS